MVEIVILKQALLWNQHIVDQPDRAEANGPQSSRVRRFANPTALRSARETGVWHPPTAGKPHASTGRFHLRRRRTALPVNWNRPDLPWTTWRIGTGGDWALCALARSD